MHANDIRIANQWTGGTALLLHFGTCSIAMCFFENANAIVKNPIAIVRCVGILIATDTLDTLPQINLFATTCLMRKIQTYGRLP